MTFTSTAWAIDGAQLTSALARRAYYNSMSGAEGVTERADLKVSQLAVPGQGLLIAPGNGSILNRYQDQVNEAYAVANPAAHEIPPEEMPTSQPTAKSYLVLITVGDPEFSQVGHPWMTSDEIAPEDALDFVYVRPWIMEVTAGTTDFGSLDLDFPGYALARLDIPSNTTTITNAMITDVRSLARPRSKEFLFVINGTGGNYVNTNAPAYESWATSSLSVKVPSWATSAKIVGFVESAVLEGELAGNLRVAVVGGSATSPVPINRTAPAVSPDRAGFNIAGTINVASYAGQTKTFRVEANVNSSGYANRLKTDGYTTSVVRILLEEAPV